MVTGAVGYGLAILAGGSPWLVVGAFAVIAIGSEGFMPAFWPIPTGFLTESAAAAAIGLINSSGNMGGFAGPFILGYASTRTHSFVGGLAVLAASLVLGAVCVLLVRNHRPAGQ